MSANANLEKSEPGSWAGARELLRRLRAIMQDHGELPGRLDRVVQLIADYMAAEVCSIYVMAPGPVLELRATKGLRPEAVRRTRLKVGEGLVGDIAANARPLALAEAQSHPLFAYLPETGEEVYHSFLGVPLLRGGRVKGVLVVQNVIPRSYSEADVEVCETVAMVLAEPIDRMIVAQGGDGRAASLPARLQGTPLSQGLAMGTAVFHQRGIVISRIVAERPDDEVARLRAALVEIEASVSRGLAAHASEAGREYQEILETYLMLVEDRGWRARMEDAIQSGLSAEAAVQKVQNETRARMLSIKDRYLRERLSDLEDLATRLLDQLVGDERVERGQELPDDAVVVARNLGPAELLDYERHRLRAVLLAEGSATAHVTIVARSLNIPLIGRCPGVITQIFDGDFVIVDGERGQVLLRPTESVRAAFSRSIASLAEEQAGFQALRALPAVSRDEVAVELNANAGLLIDLPSVRDSGAQGIGLYRTEVAFMVRDRLPDVAAQTELYAGILDEMGDKPVVFRTLDVGGDKALPFLQMDDDEENPAMGWRALRVSLDRPVLLRQQLQAMIQAAAGRRLQVVFPMVTEVAELEAARAILAEELAGWQSQGGNPPSEIKVGAMLEVPALLWQLPALFARADFVSVGSNDLFQFVFACDRGSPRLSDRYDVLSPVFLRLFSELVSEAEVASTPLSLCGELAGRPLEAMALIGCGLRSLSMPPARVPAVKAMLRSLEVGQLRSHLHDLLAAPRHSLRDDLAAYAARHGVQV
jgi:phosphotransferase system enzyme I (PtsP)